MSAVCDLAPWLRVKFSFMEQGRRHGSMYKHTSAAVVVPSSCVPEFIGFTRIVTSLMVIGH